MREQTGSAPGFLEKFVSQFIFTNVYVVVIPYRPDMHKPPTFYLLVYPSDRVASPKYRVAIEFAQLTVKKPDTPDAVLEVTDTATKSKFKLLEAPNERGQVVRLYNACKGLVPVNAPGTPPTPSKAPFPPMPASYTPQGASGAATPSSSRPSASGTPAARVSDHGKATDSEDEALAMAIAASLETAKLEPGAAASHDRYGGWADEESSEFGGWGGPTRPKSPPRAAGPAAGAAAAYTPAPLPSRAPTGPKPAIANLPGAAGSALPPIPGRQQQKPAGESYGGWAVVEEGPAGGWADGRASAPASAPPLPGSEGGVSYDYRPGGSSGAQSGASYDYHPSAGGSATPPPTAPSAPGAGYAVVGETPPSASHEAASSHGYGGTGQTHRPGGGVTYDYHPGGSGESKIAYPSIDQSPVQYPRISAEDMRKPNLGGAGASSLKKAGEPTCAVCLDQPAEAVCVPCGHVAGCMECLTEIKRKGMGCPICRMPIKEVVKIYMPN
jgi:hypothetical protein